MHKHFILHIWNKVPVFHENSFTSFYHENMYALNHSSKMLLHDMHMVHDRSMTMRLKTTTLKPNPTINMLDLHFSFSNVS